MERQNLIRNTILKFVICTIFLTTSVIMILLASATLIEKANASFMVGFIVSGIFVIVIIWFVFPVIFKDYISFYWKKQKEKEELRIAEEASQETTNTSTY